MSGRASALTEARPITVQQSNGLVGDLDKIKSMQETTDFAFAERDDQRRRPRWRAGARGRVARGRNKIALDEPAGLGEATVAGSRQGRKRSNDRQGQRA